MPNTVNLRDLSVCSYNNGFTLWHYTNRLSEPYALTPEYFSDAQAMLKPGDILLVTHHITRTNSIHGIWHNAAGELIFTPVTTHGAP